ncbi:bifunctional adenosylcobinamide kinase/adenosylcobinamide-phosphate guanylyltransferase [Isachenkonia alkalipeptolytica]|uniref:Adenosylcobinamide kinase n=1 Tax=Isachenkonia alkalipeptolytica TaxID=2565777 RepID=A0AA43XIK1_9CLOT|nr:bifunctional adenosylcobinamide kinase/adenosylcobinamide-phosphate guanylyltransferase [Isachenkonia alkalipeptolytica]NBG87106.1 bifunctional adenosylcobinamide kinase/adenosylcobinamide-phosphate guanylyltransferase [Isachenkonia alkalipeptolytica]
MITFITGGARSGKSSFGEALVKKAATVPADVLYIPTAKAYDEEMQDRINKHRIRRPKEWETLEMSTRFQGLEINSDFVERSVVMVDCLGVFVTNRMLLKERDFDQITANERDQMEKEIQREVKHLLDILREKEAFIVSNEVGMGLVPEYPMGRIFRDILGRINHEVAARADKVYFVVAGIPMCLKGEDR